MTQIKFLSLMPQESQIPLTFQDCEFFDLAGTASFGLSAEDIAKIEERAAI